ncbi:hypothetical protein GCM10022380_40330 [Amycolatopsis tucumanensis]|uniref:Secreted protein n=1 Tax=Amycolatopsis tucumanensis TaxID=401106 RepID=A0ABP7IG84_9PSEU
MLPRRGQRGVQWLAWRAAAVVPAAHWYSRGVAGSVAGRARSRLAAGWRVLPGWAQVLPGRGGFGGRRVVWQFGLLGREFLPAAHWYSRGVAGSVAGRARSRLAAGWRVPSGWAQVLAGRGQRGV